VVIAWRDAAGAHACKRLPPLPDSADYTAFASCFADYLDALRAAGLTVADSALYPLHTEQGVVAWCVQPLLPSDDLLPAVLGRVDADEARRIFDQVVARIAEVASPRLGLDAQASNWMWHEDDLVYLDVTTPLMRDDQGREALDMGLFLAALPWALRGAVRRWMLADLVDKYYAPRSAILDLVGNLRKEGLSELVPVLLPTANQAVDPPLTLAEVDRYYRSDARSWEVLLVLRRADRWWQRMVRRRTYPFLLPGRIDRGL